MHTIHDLAAALHRPVASVRGLQNQFRLPVLTDKAYSPAYLSFLRTVVWLRAFNISEERLLALWRK
jgi:hypothetical protein